MTKSSAADFDRQYQNHLQPLKLKGLQPKTIEAYSRAIRRIGAYFDHKIDSLTESQLTNYFTELLASHSWTTVKLDLYGLKFYTQHVLKKPWVAPGLIKPPKSQRLPDILTVDETRRIFAATRVLSYRVFFFTLYSLGLRLGEGRRRQVGDIDATRGRVHIRDAKGNRDRLCRCPRRPFSSCAASGRYMAIRYRCFPIVHPVAKAPPPSLHRLIQAACRPPGTKSSPPAA